MNATSELSIGYGARKPSAPVGVRLRSDELRRRMTLLGLTGGDLARRAGVAKATVFRALGGGRVYPTTLRAIAEVLANLDPIPGADKLIDHDQGGPTDGAWR